MLCVELTSLCLLLSAFPPHIRPSVQGLPAVNVRGRLGCECVPAGQGPGQLGTQVCTRGRHTGVNRQPCCLQSPLVSPRGLESIQDALISILKAI